MNDKQTLQQFIRENAFKLSAIGITALNLWVATQLAPIKQDIALVDQRVQAIEQDEPTSAKEFEEIINRLDRIEAKLDYHLTN